MKTTILNTTAMTVFLLGSFASGSALSDCRQSLDADETIECINYEGAENSYLSYTEKDFDNIVSYERDDEKSDMAVLETDE